MLWGPLVGVVLFKSTEITDLTGKPEGGNPHKLMKIQTSHRKIPGPNQGLNKGEASVLATDPLCCDFVTKMCLTLQSLGGRYTQTEVITSKKLFFRNYSSANFLFIFSHNFYFLPLKILFFQY